MVTEWAPRSGAGGLTGSKGSDGSVRVSSEASDGCTARNATSQCADGFREVDFLADSRVLWAHHLGADRMGPAVSRLLMAVRTRHPGNSVGSRTRCTWTPLQGNGLNVRSDALAPSLSVITTEIVLRLMWMPGRTRRPAAPNSTSGSSRHGGHEPLFTAQSLVGPASEGRR